MGPLAAWVEYLFLTTLLIPILAWDAVTGSPRQGWVTFTVCLRKFADIRRSRIALRAVETEIAQALLILADLWREGRQDSASYHSTSEWLRRLYDVRVDLLAEHARLEINPDGT